MSSGKAKKTLYLPEWLIKKLDAEGEIVGGPGEVTGAAILFFCDSTPENKALMLEAFHKREISEAYNLPIPAKKLAESIVDEALELAKKKKAAKVAAKS